MRYFAFNALNVFNTKMSENMIITRSLFIISIRTEIQWHSFVQQFKAGHLSLAYDIPTRHKRRLQQPTKTYCMLCAVWGWDRGVRNEINSLLICFWSIEIIRACCKAFVQKKKKKKKKKKKTRSVSLTRYLHGSLKTLVNYFIVIGQNKQKKTLSIFFYLGVY